MKTLIGFTGRAGSGKSTAASVLVEQYGFTRMSFAQPLRKMLREIGLTEEDLTSGKSEPVDWLDGKTPRQLMQTLGTEWGRGMIHTNVWVTIAERKIAQLRADGVPGIVIDDVRFDNDADMIRRLGGVVIGVLRETGPVMRHASESGVSFGLIHRHLGNHGQDRMAWQHFVATVCEAL